MNARLRSMVGHGAVVLALALLAGFGLGFSLIGGIEVFPGSIVAIELPGDSRGWARWHTGGLLNGLMVFIVAVTLHVMALPDRTESTLSWIIIGAGYANTLFYIGGLLSETRSLSFGDNRFGETSFIGVLGFAPAFVFAFASIVAMIILARHAFSSHRA